MIIVMTGQNGRRVAIRSKSVVALDEGADGGTMVHHTEDFDPLYVKESFEVVVGAVGAHEGVFHADEASRGERPK